MEGRFEPANVRWSSMTNDGNSVVNYAIPFNAAVPVTVAAGADELRMATIADPQVPFRGPLLDNMGAQQIAAGIDLTDQELDQMCYFVQGVVSTEAGPDPVPAVVPASCGGI